jgi:protein-S-isoprenylcysteine O-methyltransferase Ste14
MLEPSTTTKPDVDRRAVVRRLIQVLTTFAIQIAILFFSAGSLAWGWGWTFVAVSLSIFVANAILLGRRNPELIAERSKSNKMQGWDKLAGGLWGIFYFIGILAVSGLDYRFSWTTDLVFSWHVVGVLGYAGGGALFTWAMLENAYFSTTVRLQEERGQTVCSTGPYSFVRHPGYSGAILQGIALPFLFGSVWAIIPGILAGIMMIVRTAYEDRFLTLGLDGYEAFTQRTRYRLFPGLW